MLENRSSFFYLRHGAKSIVYNTRESVFGVEPSTKQKVKGRGKGWLGVWNVR